MTKKEAFIRVVQVGIDDKTAEMAMIEAGISPEDNFAAGGLKELEIAAIPVLQSLMVISSESEGSQSESRNLKGIEQRLLFIAEKHGLTEIIDCLKGSVPTIKAYKWL